MVLGGQLSQHLRFPSSKSRLSFFFKDIGDRHTTARLNFAVGIVKRPTSRSASRRPTVDLPLAIMPIRKIDVGFLSIICCLELQPKKHSARLRPKLLTTTRIVSQEKIRAFIMRLALLEERSSAGQPV